MFHYQLKHGAQWETQNTVTAEVAEILRASINERARTAFCRVVDASKPVSKPRAKKAVKAVEVATEVSK